MTAGLGHTLFIANPAAKNGAASREISRVAERLRALSSVSRLESVETRYAGHARELAREAQGFDTILAMGGDGIVHEICDGVMLRNDISLREDLARLKVGLLPFGSGNDYARTLGMSTNLDVAIDQLERAQPVFLDTGICNGQHFCETLSFGLDAAIALDTVERRKRTGKTGMALYLASGIDQLLHHRDVHHVRMVVDGGEERELDIHLMAVQIGCTYGGGFSICPNADPADGIFDICLAHAPLGAFEATHTFLLAKDGRHLNRRNIESFKARSLTLKFDHDLPVQIDGERVNGREFEISCIQQSLCVLRAQGE
jgi:YegS/Rv2252/BmrU family lipid kinase